MAACHLLRHQHHHRGVDRAFLKVHELEAELLGEDRYERPLRDETELDQDTTERAAALRRFIPGLLELGLGDQPAGKQQLVQLAWPLGRLSHAHIIPSRDR